MPLASLPSPARTVPSVTFDAVLCAESRLMGSARTRGAAYASVHRAARDLVPLDAFYLCLYEPKNRRLRFEYNGDEDGLDTAEAFALGGGPTSRAILSGKAFVLNHNREESGPVYLFGDPGRTSKGAIHLPFWDGCPGVGGQGAPLGVLSVQSYSLEGYGREHLQAVRWLAGRTAGLLRETEAEAAREAARLAEAEERRARVGSLMDEHRLCPSLRAALLEAVDDRPPERLEVGALTDRELQTVALAAQGLSYGRVADALGIGRETVKSHLPRAYGKLGLSDGRTLGRHLPALLAALAVRGL